MNKKKNILAIIGSASEHSTNLKLVEKIGEIAKNELKLTIYTALKSLPHFDPELSAHNPPKRVLALRNAIKKADGVIICTPEYVFSIPSGLKNAIEWCISTTVFSEKPTGLITASASGEKGHEALQLIMKTTMAKFTDETTLLIQGIKGKLSEQGDINDDIQHKIHDLIKAFISLVNEK
jgi:chromate reductase, NAD(P)H dehydrogenase (quinone)